MAYLNSECRRTPSPPTVAQIRPAVPPGVPLEYPVSATRPHRRPQCIGQPPMRPLQPGSNAAPALVAEANALWAAASQAVRRANRWSVNGTTAFPSASAPLFRKSRTSAMMMRDDLGHVRTVRCSIELRVLVQEPLRSSPQFRARVNRLADLKACTCKAARLRLPCLAFGALSCQRPQLRSPSRIRFLTYFPYTHGFCL